MNKTLTGTHVPGQGLLTDFQLLQQMRQQLVECVVLDAALDDIGGLVSAGHDFDPGLVDVGEPLCLLRELLGNVSADEDRLEVYPEVLHCHPVLNNLRRVGKICHPLLDLWPERDVVSVHKNISVLEPVLDQFRTGSELVPYRF